MFAADKISKDHRNRIYLNMIYSQVKDFLTTISDISIEELLDKPYAEIMAILENTLYNNKTKNGPITQRTRFDEYIYKGMPDEHLKLTQDETYVVIVYIWFTEKYLIPTDTIIEARTPLYFGARRNLYGNDGSARKASQKLRELEKMLKEKYGIELNKTEYDRYLKILKKNYYELTNDCWFDRYYKNYIAYSSKNCFDHKLETITDDLKSRLLKIGITEIKELHNGPHNQNRSEQIKLLVYLYNIEHSNLLRLDLRAYKYRDLLITDILKDDALEAEDFKYFGDVYEKMIYDISLALDFDFLSKLYSNLTTAVSEWSSFISEYNHLMYRLPSDKLHSWGKELSDSIIQEVDTGITCSKISNNSVLEAFYTRLKINEIIFGFNMRLKMLNKLKSVAISEENKIPDQIFLTEGSCLKYSDEQDKQYLMSSPEALKVTRKYVDDHIKSITEFVYGCDDSTKRKQIRRRADTIHNALIMIQDFYQISYVSECMIYLAYKEYHSLRQIEFEGLYPLNKTGVATAFHELSVNKVSDINRHIFLNMIDKRKAYLLDQQNWYYARMDSEIKITEYVISLLKTRKIETICAETDARINKLKKRIASFQKNHKITTSNFAIVRAVPEV